MEGAAALWYEPFVRAALLHTGSGAREAVDAPRCGPCLRTLAASRHPALRAAAAACAAPELAKTVGASIRAALQHGAADRAAALFELATLAMHGAAPASRVTNPLTTALSSLLGGRGRAPTERGLTVWCAHTRSVVAWMERSASTRLDSASAAGLSRWHQRVGASFALALKPLSRAVAAAAGTNTSTRVAAAHIGDALAAIWRWRGVLQAAEASPKRGRGGDLPGPSPLALAPDVGRAAMEALDAAGAGEACSALREPLCAVLSAAIAATVAVPPPEALHGALHEARGETGGEGGALAAWDALQHHPAWSLAGLGGAERGPGPCHTALWDAVLGLVQRATQEAEALWSGAVAARSQTQSQEAHGAAAAAVATAAGVDEAASLGGMVTALTARCCRLPAASAAAAAALTRCAVDLCEAARAWEAARAATRDSGEEGQAVLPSWHSALGGLRGEAARALDGGGDVAPAARQAAVHVAASCLVAAAVSSDGADGEGARLGKGPRSVDRSGVQLLLCSACLHGGEGARDSVAAVSAWEEPLRALRLCELVDEALVAADMARAALARCGAGGAGSPSSTRLCGAAAAALTAGAPLCGPAAAGRLHPDAATAHALLWAEALGALLRRGGAAERGPQRAARAAKALAREARRGWAQDSPYDRTARSLGAALRAAVGTPGSAGEGADRARSRARQEVEEAVRLLETRGKEGLPASGDAGAAAMEADRAGADARQRSSGRKRGTGSAGVGAHPPKRRRGADPAK